MGVTRKEKLLKAMLEDNAAGCGGGVTREEKMLAGVAKKTCDNNALEGGGSGGEKTFIITEQWNESIGENVYSANMTFDELEALWLARNPPAHVLMSCEISSSGEGYLRYWLAEEVEYGITPDDESVRFFTLHVGPYVRYYSDGRIVSLDL